MRGRQDDRVEGLELTSSHKNTKSQPPAEQLSTTKKKRTYQKRYSISKDKKKKSQGDVLPRTNQEEIANMSRLITSTEIETVI